MATSIGEAAQQFYQVMEPYHDKQELRQQFLLLCESLLDLPAYKVSAFPETKISISDYNRLLLAYERLKNNEPIQYVIGKTEFYGLEFLVEPGVLIPRPETEELVDRIIEQNSLERPVIIDIGTGSGCIAISLAKGIPAAQVHAMDISEKALWIASKNAKHNLADVQFYLVDVLKLNGFPCSLADVVVSNPPYVTESEKKLMHANVLDFEPHTALFVSDNDPLLFYRKIALLSTTGLNKGGKLYFEINERFGEETQQMLLGMGFQNVKIITDLFGKARMTEAIWLGT